MTTHFVRNEAEREQAIRLIKARSAPFTINVKQGVDRSTDQNRLAFMWFREASEQLQDETPEEKRAYAKLALGVPILRSEDDDFREAYDRLIKPRPYEEKLALMSPPLEWPVTSLMTTRQFTKFLDQLQHHYATQGVRLTQPDSILGDAA